MPVTLAELKGLAVRRMNADPRIPLKGGKGLTRNFIVDTEHVWGFASLRFDERVHLLLVPDCPAALLGGGSNRQGFVIASDASVTPEKQKLFGLPPRTLRIDGVFDEPDQAVDRASIVGSSFDFLKRIGAGEFVNRTAGCFVDEDRNESSWSDNRIADNLDLSLFDSCEANPPTIASVMTLASGIRKTHSTKPETKHHWEKFSVAAGRSVLDLPALLFGTTHESFQHPSIPGDLFDEDAGKPDSMLHHPGIVTLVKTAKALDLDVARALPQLPVERFTIISIRPSWGMAIVKATSEWFMRQLNDELQARLAEGEDK